MAMGWGGGGNDYWKAIILKKFGQRRAIIRGTAIIRGNMVSLYFTSGVAKSAVKNSAA